ncbi:hypothetical protein [Sinorhizobium fredii]|uniref:hypothetical protein n=1 Tax=Rhizobium fredii TaxID=380 RepID=UPI003511167C
MADSDNSRTLSTVTRREFHSFVAASLPTYQELNGTKHLPSNACNDDPALAVWYQWCIAWDRLSESSSRQQQLETSLLSVAMPPTPESAACSRAYINALETEDRASIAEDQAAAALWRTPALSVAGAAAKLHTIVNRWQPSATSQEDPWPQVRGVIADLLKIDLALAENSPNRPPRREARLAFSGG